MVVHSYGWSSKTGMHKGIRFALTTSIVYVLHCRSHHAFIEEVLDAFTLAKALQHFGLDDIDGIPKKNAPPVLLQLRNKEAQYLWLLNQASVIRKELLSPGECQGVDLATDLTAGKDMVQQALQAMQQDDGQYKCPHCTKKPYKREGNLRNHLIKEHEFNFEVANPVREQAASSAKVVVASFCQMGFLYRDTGDAYKMADGNRIFANAKLEMLYAFSLKHTKYRLWLWRMLAYEIALLTPCEAFDYKWNTCVNLSGGVGKNIPNDNAVELQVGEIKKRLQREGSNKSFHSAQTICKTTQITEKVFQNLQKENNSHVSSKERPEVRKMADINLLVQEISEANVFSEDTNFGTFVDYKDPLARLDVSKFHNWVKEQKKVASVLMVRNAHL